MKMIIRKKMLKVYFLLFLNKTTNGTNLTKEIYNTEKLPKEALIKGD
jgi:hypothetical protein